MLDSARSEAVIQKRVAAYEQARKACEQAISLYEDFHYLAGELYVLFEPVTPQGELHSLGAIRDDLGVLLELLALVPIPEVGALASRLEAQAPGLLLFLGEWAESYAALQTQVDAPELLSALLLEAALSCGKYSKASRPLAQHTLTSLKEHLDPQCSRKAERFSPLDPRLFPGRNRPQLAVPLSAQAKRGDTRLLGVIPPGAQYPHLSPRKT